MIGLWLLQDKDFPTANHHKNLVAGLQAQRFASLTRDYDLILCRKGGFRSIGLWLLQDKDFPTANHHKNLVAGLQAQRFASLTRDYDLILCRKSGFRHRFTF